MATITLPIELAPERLGELAAEALINSNERSDEFVRKFLKAFDASFESYEATLEMARFFVREVAVEHADDGEPFSLKEIFGDIVKEAFTRPRVTISELKD